MNTRKAMHGRAKPPAIAVNPLPDRLAAGKALRGATPRDSHAEWKAPARRADPVQLLVETSKGRLPDMLPLRWGKMMASPFAFYRGAAAIMAADLARTPRTGSYVQACGDCHLLNFGGFATPERRVAFDLSDFDETLPAPWEWDLKRLATSFVLASRANGRSRADARDAALACARSYRERIAEYAQLDALDIWYSCIDEKAVLGEFKGTDAAKRILRSVSTKRAQDAADHDFPSLAEVKGGVVRIRDDPPLIFHPEKMGNRAFDAEARATLARYRQTLSDDRRQLLDRYTPLDVAAKVVGVGSVGTWCGIVLLMADATDPLFLQIKEARRSVLEPHAGASAYANRGQRVAMGQRLMQATSDVFLGWTAGSSGHHYYVRQLRDIKLKTVVESFTPAEMEVYARLCGWTLARAHARSGDAALISGYLGKTGQMDRALAAFALAYAAQNERDHAALVAAIRAGRIEAQPEDK